MSRACPGLNITDMNTTIEWYQDFLGFKCTFKVPNEAIPPYAIVSKNEVSIHLSLDLTDSLSGTGFCYIETENIDILYKQLVDAGVIFIREIEDSSYGMRDFVVKDYEGNKISFGEVKT
ncbi:MAG: VOC family protein [Pseudomonadales bacterium]